MFFDNLVSRLRTECTRQMASRKTCLLHYKLIFQGKWQKIWILSTFFPSFKDKFSNSFQHTIHYIQTLLQLVLWSNIWLLAGLLRFNTITEPLKNHSCFESHWQQKPFIRSTWNVSIRLWNPDSANMMLTSMYSTLEKHGWSSICC